MKSIKPLALASLVTAIIVVAGCVPSLHPIYTEADLVIEPKLEGVWKEPDSTATWSIKRADDQSEKTYAIVQTDEDAKRGEFIGHLAKVDGRLFLDLSPKEPKIDQASDFYHMHLMPVHTIVHVQQIEPTLKATMLDPKWLEEHLKKNPAALKHEIVEDTLVLTASTKDLQQFFVKHLSTEGAYGEAMELARQKPAAAP